MWLSMFAYTPGFGGGQYAALASSVGSLTWDRPSSYEFLQLAKEGEYDAWTLVNGYELNHVTITTDQLKSQLQEIKDLNQFIKKSGFSLNSEGGVLKVSLTVFCCKAQQLLIQDLSSFWMALQCLYPVHTLSLPSVLSCLSIKYSG